MNKVVVRELSDYEKMIIYRIKYTAYKYCESIFMIDNLKVDKIRLTFAGEEMQPDRRIIVLSKEELIEELEKNEKVSMCYFQCIYNKSTEVNINVDYESNLFEVICPSNMIDEGDLLANRIEDLISSKE